MLQLCKQGGLKRWRCGQKDFDSGHRSDTHGKPALMMYSGRQEPFAAREATRMKFRKDLPSPLRELGIVPRAWDLKVARDQEAPGYGK